MNGINENTRDTEPMLDLQAQQEGESDKAYLAYTTYRDMGASRSILASYSIYLKRIGKARAKMSAKVQTPSMTFREWSAAFRWEERARDWDSKKRQRIQSEQLEADRQSYIQRVEDSRAALERTATMGMKVAEAAIAIAYEQLQGIAKAGEAAPLTKVELDRLVAITRIVKDSIDTLAAAKTEIYDALGLVQIVEQLVSGAMVGPH